MERKDRKQMDDGNEKRRKKKRRKDRKTMHSGKEEGWTMERRRDGRWKRRDGKQMDKEKDSAGGGKNGGMRGREMHVEGPPRQQTLRTNKTK